MRQRVGSWFIDRFVSFFLPRINPLIQRLLKSRVHWILNWYVVLLVVPGRKSGRVYEVPLAYHRGVNGSIEALTSPNGLWWKNLRGIEHMAVIFRGRRVESAKLDLVEHDVGAEVPGPGATGHWPARHRTVAT